MLGYKFILGWLVERSELPKMLSVSEGHPSRTINFDDILMVLTNLHYYSCALPSLGVVSH